MDRSDSFEQSPLLRLPLEIRLIIYKNLLIGDWSDEEKVAYRDYFEYEKIENAGEMDIPRRTVSIRYQDPESFSVARHKQKFRSSFKIRAGRYRMQTVPTTYCCTSLQEIHTNILAVNHQIHEEAAPILYGSYVFDFDTHVEASVPFFEDLTPYSRSCIRSVKVVKKGLPYEKDFDRCEWRTMCRYIATKLSLTALSLGVVSGKPIVGWDLIRPFPECEIESIVTTYKRDEMQWVRDLLMIKDLQRLDIAPCIEHCPPPCSNAMAFFISFSASIAGGFSNWLTHQMLPVVTAA